LIRETTSISGKRVKRVTHEVRFPISDEGYKQRDEFFRLHPDYYAGMDTFTHELMANKLVEIQNPNKRTFIPEGVRAVDRMEKEK